MKRITYPLVLPGKKVPYEYLYNNPINYHEYQPNSVKYRNLFNTCAVFNRVTLVHLPDLHVPKQAEAGWLTVSVYIQYTISEPSAEFTTVAERIHTG